MKRPELESKYAKERAIEKLKSYKTRRSFCIELSKKEKKKYYERLDLANVTDSMIARRSGKLLKHSCCIRLQFFENAIIIKT